MVRHVHPVPRLCVCKTGRALMRAREGSVDWRKGCLPHLGELVQNIRVLCLVCFVVHEDDGALAAQDHVGEGGPVIETHGDFRGFVDVVD